MRHVVMVRIPVETGNAAIIDGSLPVKIKAILDELKPEAAYFTEIDGLRTGILVVDLKEASQIPAIAEPFFLAFKAQVEFHPTMVLDDLMKAAPHFEHCVKAYANGSAAKAAH